MKNKNYDTSIEELSKMHLNLLPYSIPSLLSFNYLKEFYKYLANSDYEHIIEIKGEEGLCAFSVYSSNPSSLGRRLLLHTPLILSLFKIFLNGSYKNIISLMKQYIYNKKNNFPEIIYLMVKEEYRTYGYGKKLIFQNIEYARKNKNKFISVRCEENLIKFYSYFGFKLTQNGHQNILKLKI